eukprot:scaffold14974_cov195-Amphora_coffeaeformis.AAC.38
MTVKKEKGRRPLELFFGWWMMRTTTKQRDITGLLHGPPPPHPIRARWLPRTERTLGIIWDWRTRLLVQSQCVGSAAKNKTMTSDLPLSPRVYLYMQQP